VTDNTEQPDGVGQDASSEKDLSDEQSVAVLCQRIENGIPVMACVMHREPFDTSLCRHDARLPAEVLQVPLPSWWDGWYDLGNDWYAAKIDLEPALLAALLVGANTKDQVRACSRRAIGKIVEQADAVLKVPDNGDDRHNPDLDDIMAA